MNDFNFIMPKNEKLNLEAIKRVDPARVLLRNDFSELASALNNMVLSDFSADALPYSDSRFYNDYAKILDIFQFSIKHLHALQNVSLEEVSEKYKKFNKNKENLNKINKQRKEVEEKNYFLQGKKEEMDLEGRKLKEEAQDLNYKYKCPECLQVDIYI